MESEKEKVREINSENEKGGKKPTFFFLLC
jgi:hypothetical protein